MKFSIIINVLNGENYLEETISSVLSQSYNNFELIIIDNASTDSTHEICKRFSDSRVRYKRLKKTQPLGKSRNIALAMTTGEVISFLDSDDLYHLDRLKIYADQFTKNEKIAILYSNSEIIGKQGQHKRYLYQRLMPSGNLTKELIERYFLSLETVCFRKSALGETKFNDEFGFIEEADFFIRLSENRLIKYVNAPLAKWREHADSLTALYPENFHLEAENWLMYLNEQHKDFFQKYENGIRKFIVTQSIFKAKMNYLNGSGSKMNWAHSLLQRSRFKDYIQIILIILLPKPILKKIYIDEHAN